MFNLSKIMKRAWAIYRQQFIGCRPANEAARRKVFANCLKGAWAGVKYEAAQARKTLQERAADRVQSLTAELMRIDARPWRMSTEADRRAVMAELATAQRNLTA